MLISFAKKNLNFYAIPFTFLGKNNALFYICQKGTHSKNYNSIFFVQYIRIYAN